MPAKSPRCPHCGAPLAAGRSGGICAACALGDALNDVGERFDGHELLAEIARGGMGVVYRARQRDPQREVALKTLLGVSLSSASAHARFRLEARAMANLHHPGILPVYACGEQDGVPFFTMQLASGGTLAERVTRFKEMWREIAELIANLADAVQYAHEHGVLHRDIKPGNILFDEAGRAFVSDFGLAKMTDADSSLTRSSAMIGTPRYLAPELVSKDVGAATISSDIWGLGAMLYELCAQRPPFEGESTAALLRRIVEDSPAQLPKETPRDLGVIVFKAIAKDPAARYASARELAEDLRRWLSGRPILARPATALEKLAAWGGRNPGLAASLVVLAVTLGVFAFVEARNVAHLKDALAQTTLREIRLQRSSGRSGQRLDSLETLSNLSKSWPKNNLEVLRTEVVAALALPDLRPASRWTAPHITVTATEAFSADLSQYAGATTNGFALFDTATRGIVHFWPHTKPEDAQEFTVGPGGGWLSVRFGDGHTELWPVATNLARISTRASVLMHPDGVTYLRAREGLGLFRVSLKDGKEQRVLPPPVYQSPFLLDRAGERVRARTGDTRRGFVARLSDGEVLAKIQKVPHRVTALDWSPDGRWIAMANGEPPYAVTIHDAQTGDEVAQFVEHQMPVRILRFHPGSSSFAAVSDGHQLIWRSVEPGGFRVEIPASSHALEFSKDGSRLGYSPSDGELGMLSVAGSDAFRAWPEPPRDQTGAAYTAAFSADGRWAAVASDKSLRIWDARKHIPVDVKMNGPARSWWNNVFFTPAPEPQIVWSPLGGGIWKAGVSPSGLLQSVTNIHTSPDSMVQELAEGGRSLVVIDGLGDAKRAELWPDGDRAKSRVLGRGIPFAGFRLLQAGKTGVSTHYADPDLWLWDTASGNRIRSLGLTEPVASEPSPDGRWLLTGTRSEHVLWDTKSWEPVSRWVSRTGERDVWAPTFSPDSKLLAKATPLGEIVLRRIPSGEEIVTLTPPKPIRLQQITFAENGAKLMMLQATGRIYEWDIALLRAELGKMGLAW